MAGKETSLWQRTKNFLRPSGKRAKKSWYDALPYPYFQTLVQTPGKPVWMPREFVKFADEGYIRNVIVHRSIAMIAQGAASVPWRLFFREEGNRFEVKEHPLLRLLANPSPSENGKQFFEALYSYRYISGNAFVQAVVTGDDLPRELHNLRPDRVSIIPGKDGMPVSYEHKVGEVVQKFPVDRLTGRSNILHLKTFHPLNDHHGLSAIDPAAYSIDQHNQAGVWNQALLQNSARPGGALVVKMADDGSGGSLTDDQYTRIKHQIDDQFAGAENAGRPLLLEGGMDWREMSLSPKDMDFIDAKHSAARDIALAFGVPPQLLGIPGDNTYSNLIEARQSLWEQTILPLVDNVTCALNSWLVPMFGGGFELSYDTDDVAALAPKREKVWARISKTDFMTINEKRQAVGLPPLDEGGDVLDSGVGG